jgi:2,3-bisphosphoglycerate-independent phosphoglycerate mutase
MKYAIVLPDGAADFPLDALDGMTPFEAADTPNIDELAIDGRLGTVRTTPDNMPCGSDTCTMSLLGYDPQRYHTGRAPLEAAAMGIDLARTDWVFRVNLVSAPDGVMQDHSAGHIGDAEAAQLLADFAAAHRWPGFELRPGVSYRHILVDRDPDRDWDELVTVAPHDIPGQGDRKSVV